MADERDRLPVPSETDVERIHRTLLREPREPEEGREPAPWWLWLLAALGLFWGGYYLGRHGGLFAPIAHIGYQPVISNPSTAPSAAAPVSGSQIYQQNCAACHQTTGMGLPGSFPPLVGSDLVLRDPQTPVRIVLRGLQGPVTLAGATYNGVMPAWADKLSDAEIAAVLSYVRQDLGTNKAGPIDASLVSKLRQETQAHTGTWTATELQPLRGRD